MKKDDDLEKWLEKRREFYFWLQRFEEKIKNSREPAKIFNISYEKTSYLTGSELVKANSYLKKYPSDLKAESYVRYIQSSQKNTLRNRSIIIAFLALISFAAVYSNDQKNTSESLQYVALSEKNLETDTTRSLLFSIQASLVKDTPEARVALWKAIQANHERIKIDVYPSGVSKAFYAVNNSRQIVTVGAKTVDVWNLEDFQKPNITLKGDQDNISHTEFSPHVKNLILTTSYDGKLRLWNTDKSMNQDVKQLKDGMGDITYGTFDPVNSDRILTVGNKGNVKLWEMSSSKSTIFVGHQGEVNYTEFNASTPSQFLTTGKDGTVRVWDTKSPDKHIILDGHKGSVTYAAFNPKQSNQLVSIGMDNTLRVWDLTDLSKHKILRGHTGQISGVKFDPHMPNRVMSYGDDASVRIWDLDQPDKNPIILKESSSSISSSIFNPSKANQLIVGSQDGRIMIWDVSKSDSPKLIQKFLGHTSAISSINFSPDDPNRVMTSSRDGTVRIWDIDNYLFEILNSEQTANGGKNNVESFMLVNHENKRTLSALTKPGELINWVLPSVGNSQEPLTDLKAVEADKKAPKNGTIFLSPNIPNSFASIEKTGDITFYDSHNFEAKLRSENEIHNVIFDSKSSNRLLLIGSRSSTIWDPRSSQKFDISLGSKSITFGLFLANHPDLIALSSNTGDLIIRDISRPDGKNIWEKSISGREIWHISSDPKNDEKILVVGGDQTARIINLKERREEKMLSDHKDTLIRGRFNPNNPDQILTVGERGAVYIHSLSTNNPFTIDLIDNNIQIKDAFFDQLNSEIIITLGSDGIIRSFSISTQNLLKKAENSISRNFTPEEKLRHKIK